MKKARYVIIVLISLLLASCTQPRLLLNYGREDRLLIYCDTSYKEEKIILYVQGYRFAFKKSDLNSFFKTEYGDIFEGLSYQKNFRTEFLESNKSLEISVTKYEVYLNNVMVQFPLSSDITSGLDNLVKNGKFFVTKNGKPIKYLEYKHWDPQYQGAITSKWIIKDKTIFELILGFVN